MPSGPTLLLYLQKHYDLLTGDGVAEENPNPERVWNGFFFSQTAFSLNINKAVKISPILK